MISELNYTKECSKWPLIVSVSFVTICGVNACNLVSLICKTVKEFSFTAFYIHYIHDKFSNRKHVRIPKVLNSKASNWSTEKNKQHKFAALGIEIYK